MAKNKGTLIVSPIRPIYDNNNIPVAYSNEIKGGYHSVGTITERNAILSSRLQEGMLCYVSDVNKLYIYLSSTWVEKSIEKIETINDWLDSVISFLSTPPASPSIGDRYIVNIGSGAWSGRNNNVATWTGTSWEYTSPTYMTSVRSESSLDSVFTFDGTKWIEHKFQDLERYPKYYIDNNTNINITNGSEYLIYGNLTNNGNIINDGKIVLINGTMSGTYSGSGTFSSIELLNNILVSQGLTISSTSIGVRNIGLDLNIGDGLTFSYTGNTLNLSTIEKDFGYNKYIILENEIINVGKNEEYLIYGDLTVYGELNIDNDAKVVIINGTVSVLNSGTVSNMGNVEIYDLGYESISPTELFFEGDGVGSVVQGINNYGYKPKSTTFGDNNIVDAYVGVAFGTDNYVRGTSSIIIGINNQSTTASLTSLTLGSNNINESVYTALMGYNNKAKGGSSIINGLGVTYSGSYSVINMYMSYVTASNSLILGKNSLLSTNYTIANIDNSEINNATFSIISGDNIIVSSSYNFILGSEINLNYNSTHNTVNGKDVVLVGRYNILNGYDVIINGNNNILVGSASSVIGNDNFVLGENNHCIGNLTFIMGKNNSFAGSLNIAIIGDSNSVNYGAEYSMMIGNDNNTYYGYSLVIGTNSVSGGVNNLTIGNYANSYGTCNLTIGNNINNNSNNSLVMGNYSYSNSESSFVFGDNIYSNHSNSMLSGNGVFSIAPYEFSRSHSATASYGYFTMDTNTIDDETVDFSINDYSLNLYYVHKLKIEIIGKSVDGYLYEHTIDALTDNGVILRQESIIPTDSNYYHGGVSLIDDLITFQPIRLQVTGILGKTIYWFAKFSYIRLLS